MLERTTTTNNAAPKPERILVSEDEAAALLAVSKPVFRRWVQDGLLAPVDLPVRRNLYRRSDPEAFAASPTKSGGAGA